MRIISIVLLFVLFSCSNEPQTESEIFRLSKEEIFKYLKQNNLVKDSAEIKRKTQNVEYPEKDIDPIKIKYYIKREADSLWIIHAYREEYLEDETLFIRLSPKLKDIITQEENNRSIPKYDKIWSGGMYEY
jgi:hypothetical protein